MALSSYADADALSVYLQKQISSHMGGGAPRRGDYTTDSPPPDSRRAAPLTWRGDAQRSCRGVTLTMKPV
ncbi:Protein of unknown function [Gryllus bimaculatus]|nr:Protein of unknown function [Gryllus bimaculatus]